MTALRWPTKSILVFQPSLSTIWAVGPELFIAWADTRYWPSGDQDRRRTWVVPPHWDTERKKFRHSAMNQCMWQIMSETKANSILYLTEGFGDVGFHLPIHCPPHFEAVVIGLRGNVFSHRIPRQTLHQPSVSSQTSHHLWRDTKKTEGWADENCLSALSAGLYCKDFNNRIRANNPK